MYTPAPSADTRHPDLGKIRIIFKPNVQNGIKFGQKDQIKV